MVVKCSEEKRRKSCGDVYKLFHANVKKNNMSSRAGCSFLEAGPFIAINKLSHVQLCQEYLVSNLGPKGVFYSKRREWRG